MSPLTVDDIRIRHAEGCYCAHPCAPAIAVLLLHSRRLTDENAALRAEGERLRKELVTARSYNHHREKVKEG